MSFSIGIRVYVKFRIFGITLGTFDRSVSGSVTPGGAVSFAAISGPPASGATTLFNEQGVLLQIWA